MKRGTALLPFLKNRNQSQVGVIVKERAPDEKPQESDDISGSGIEACAEELIRAVHAKDTKAAAAALKDAFQVLESQPHEEQSESDNTYAAQNAKAAKSE